MCPLGQIMATILNEEDKDTEEGATTQLAGAPGVSAPTGQAPATGQPTSSGLYTNLANYLSANKKATEQMGQRLASGITNTGEEARGSLEQAKTRFGEESQAGRTVYNPNLVSSALADPTTAAQNTETKASFQKQLAGSYGGPSALDLNTVTGKANLAQEQANLARSGAGRNVLLGQTFSSPTYTGGQRKLDQTLLGLSPTEKQRFGQVATQQRGLGRQITNEASTAQALGQQYGHEASYAGQQATGQLSGSIQQFLQSMKEQATAAQQAREAEQDRIARNLGNQYVLPENVFGDAGFKPGGTYGVLGGIDINKYLTKQPTANTPEIVASSGDYERINALQQLADKYTQPDMQGVFNQFSDPTLAGSYQKQLPVKFDYNAFRDATGALFSDYDKYAKDLKDSPINMAALVESSGRSAADLKALYDHDVQISKQTNTPITGISKEYGDIMSVWQNAVNETSSNKYIPKGFLTGNNEVLDLQSSTDPIWSSFGQTGEIR